MNQPSIAVAVQDDDLCHLSLEKTTSKKLLTYHICGDIITLCGDIITSREHKGRYCVIYHLLSYAPSLIEKQLDKEIIKV